MALMPQESFTDRERRRRREASERARTRKRMKPMTETDLAEKVAKAEVLARDEERQAVGAHIKKLEARMRAGGRDTLMQLTALRGSSDAHVAAELAKARELRAELESEAQRAPLEHLRSGRRVDVHDRRFILMRAKELREQLWAKAERAEGRGEFGEATRYRLDALRSRHLAEHEFGLRRSLPGY